MINTITIEYDDTKTPIILNAFEKSSGSLLTISGDKDINGNHFRGHWNFTIDEKGGSETNKEFVVRFIVEHIKAIIKMVDYAEDRDRYNDEVALITPPAQNIPEDIITGS